MWTGSVFSLLSRNVNLAVVSSAVASSNFTLTNVTDGPLAAPPQPHRIRAAVRRGRIVFMRTVKARLARASMRVEVGVLIFRICL
jgi:hypothetical protein